LAETLWGGTTPLAFDGDARQQIRLGVLRDRAGYHVYHMLACRELGVPFVVLDLESNRWVEAVRAAKCDGYLAWPSLNLAVWKEAWDCRLPLLQEMTHNPICPSVEEIRLLDSKRRVADWLRARDVPHPPTEIFYDECSAQDFARHCELPIVLKTSGGSSSHGVFVIRSRGALKRAVTKAFRKGIRTKRGDARERAWGYVVLQRFVPHDHEWRVMRVGDQFLCRRKERVGDFASGAKRVEWARPSPELLDFVEAVTNRGGFRAMALDVFSSPSGSGEDTFQVNEMQCLVGAAPSSDHPERGRWRRAGTGWVFEAGDFYRNACANLRVAWLLETLGQAQSGRGKGRAC
jgi:hypothetical protein